MDFWLLYQFCASSRIMEHFKNGNKRLSIHWDSSTTHGSFILGTILVSIDAFFNSTHFFVTLWLNLGEHVFGRTCFFRTKKIFYFRTYFTKICYSMDKSIKFDRVYLFFGRNHPSVLDLLISRAFRKLWSD